MAQLSGLVPRSRASGDFQTKWSGKCTRGWAAAISSSGMRGSTKRICQRRPRGWGVQACPVPMLYTQYATSFGLETQRSKRRDCDCCEQSAVPFPWFCTGVFCSQMFWVGFRRNVRPAFYQPPHLVAWEKQLDIREQMFQMLSSFCLQHDGMQNGRARRETKKPGSPAARGPRTTPVSQRHGPHLSFPNRQERWTAGLSPE